MTDKPLFDPKTDAALRALDPAPERPAGKLSAAERSVASATLTRVVASDPAAPARHEVEPRQRHRRWLLAPIIAAATVIALALGIGLPSTRAYADWLATPSPLSVAQAAAAMSTCLEDLELRDGLQFSEPPRLLLGEQRGGWTYVLFMPSSKSQASCLLPHDQDPDDARRWGSFDSEIPDDPPARAGQVQEWSYAVGTTKEGLFSWTEGVVGNDITGVTITTPIGDKVIASVANGRYAAWWPAGKNKLNNPQLMDGIGIDATLRDGTTKVIQSR